MHKDKKYELDYIEYDIVGHCNLNCKGCSHFSNLQNKKQFVSTESYKKDLSRIKELFYKIKRIKILGGEPLLHPKLDEIIKITRNILPNTKIDIVTNGLLIKKADKELWNIFKKYNVKLIITMYKNTNKIRNEIIETIQNNELYYELYEEKIEFRRQLTNINKKRKWASHIKCDIKKCTGIQNGMLGKCPMSIHMHRYNKRFNTKFPDNEFINIHEKETTAKEILKFIKKPINLCKYCSTKHEIFKWEQANYEQSKKEDWICIYNENVIIGNIKAFISYCIILLKKIKKNSKKQLENLYKVAIINRKNNSN